MYSTIVTNILMGFKILVKLGSCPNYFQNHPRGDGFFKNGSQLHDPRMVFFRPNFRDNFFFVRINFKGISFVNLKAI